MFRGFCVLETAMLTADDVLRAQARALIRVLVHYKLDRVCGREPTSLWGALEVFGTASGTAPDLQTIGRKYANAAAAAFCVGMKHRAPNAALYLALVSFTGPTPEYRFLEPSRWISVALAYQEKKLVPEPSLQGEVLEKLEAAFEAEIAIESEGSESK
jgi:hypothetical protein